MKKSIKRKLRPLFKKLSEMPSQSLKCEKIAYLLKKGPVPNKSRNLIPLFTTIRFSPK